MKNVGSIKFLTKHVQNYLFFDWAVTRKRLIISQTNVFLVSLSARMARRETIYSREFRELYVEICISLFT